MKGAPNMTAARNSSGSFLATSSVGLFLAGIETVGIATVYHHTSYKIQINRQNTTLLYTILYVLSLEIYISAALNIASIFIYDCWFRDIVAIQCNGDTEYTFNGVIYFINYIINIFIILLCRIDVNSLRMGIAILICAFDV